MRHQNKLLAETLGACILASGIVRKDIDGFTGPELLHFGEDLRSMLEAAPQQEVQGPAVGDPTRWFTVVYRDISPGDEARLLAEHPKASAMSWSHALHDRDAALAAKAKQGEPLTDAQIAELMRDTWGCASIAPRHALEFARAIERAHGITQKGGS